MPTDKDDKKTGGPNATGGADANEDTVASDTNSVSAAVASADATSDEGVDDLELVAKIVEARLSQRLPNDNQPSRVPPLSTSATGSLPPDVAATATATTTDGNIQRSDSDLDLLQIVAERSAIGSAADNQTNQMRKDKKNEEGKQQIAIGVPDSFSNEIMDTENAVLANILKEETNQEVNIEEARHTTANPKDDANPTPTCNHAEEVLPHLTLDRQSASTFMQPGAYALAPLPGSLQYIEANEMRHARRVASANGEERGIASAPREAAVEVGHLVVASPVDDSSRNNHLDLPRAEEVDASAEGRRQQKTTHGTTVVAALVLLLLLGVILVVVLTVRGSAAGSRSAKGTAPSIVTSSPTSAPTTIMEGYMAYTKALFPNHTLDAIQDEESPQSLAYQWLLSDPALSTYPDWRIRQRFALATFFHATGGPTWYNSTNWLSYDESVHECDWFYNGELSAGPDEFGIFNTSYPNPCQGASNSTSSVGHYRHLWLASNGLVCQQMPEELYWLTSLQSLSIEVNQLGGTMSSSIGSLSSLETLYFVFNGFTGSIPSEIGLLSNMTELILLSNDLTGTIPSQLGALPMLQALLLDSNQLEGEIPSELGLLSSLGVLYLFENQLTGKIPSELVNLSVLEELILFGNQLSGSIMTQLGEASSLHAIYLNQNLISGPIPSELGALTNLAVLSLGDNMLSSSIPSQLGNLANLNELDLSYNSHTSTILPPELYGLTNLTKLMFPKSGLNGTLPTEIGLMTNVMELAVFGNQFTGSTIPSELGTATGMRWILMSRCGFSGTIPSEIGQLPLLEVLRFQGNDLEGTIPDEIGDLANNASLFDFRVDSGNVMLTGTIPVGLCGVRMVFDCSDFLCGCGCVCSDGNTTSGSNSTMIVNGDETL